MESTLSLKKSDFEAKVGLYFGWGQTEWSTNDRKSAIIRDCVESGLRQFYFPPPLGGFPYDWSFLRPTLSLTFADGDSTVELPDDFGGFEGQVTITTPTARVRVPIRFVNEGIVREAYSLNAESSGPPKLVALRPIKGTTLNEGQRFELYIFPAADEDYTIAFRYYILANKLDGTHPYAYGGMMHTETILESCLAIAEQRYDDMQGVHSAKFLERLAASIAADRRLKPQFGGRNTDLSDEYLTNRNRASEVVVTYNGVEY